MSMARYSPMAWTAQRAPAPAGLSWCTACRGRGGSAPGADACRVPRPGRGPGGSGFQRVRPLEDRGAHGSRRGAAGRRLRGPVPDGPGRTQGRAAPGCMPRPDGQPADTPRSARPPGAHGRASNASPWPARPPAPAAAGPRRSVRRAHRQPPGAQRPRGLRPGCAPPARGRGPVRARGWPGGGPPGAATESQRPNTP